MQSIQGIIQSQESEGKIYFYIIPSPRLGITARCGYWISDSQVWGDVESSAVDCDETPTHRVEAIVEENEDDSVTVLSLSVIKG